MNHNSPADVSARLFAEACRVLPGGVNSPVRAFRAVGGHPRFIVRAEGCRLFDADGRAFIDYIGGYGPLILGHAHPRVLAALERAVRDGVCFGAPTPLETRLADEIVQRVPSIERVRMVNSGTEAVMSALRLARAATNRDIIIKFNGCYHGHADAMLVAAGSGVSTLGLPNSPGVTSGAVRDTLTAEYNDLAYVADMLAVRGGDVAAVIVEPVAGNMGVVLPQPGFLEGLRELTRRHGALLIFDEVMTGFRLGPAGAQGVYGVTPDLTTLGKIIGGGLPVGAYGGRADLMDRVAPQGAVYQAGTLSGNPLAMVAGLATLNELDADAYTRLESQARRLADGLTIAIEDAATDAVVSRSGSMVTVFFHREMPIKLPQVQASDHNRFGRVFHGLLNRGIHLPPSGYEAWFVSLAHNEQELSATISAFRESLAEKPHPLD
jgi:glutamate-1-semialdehyde 2,1-aminomutase